MYNRIYTRMLAEIMKQNNSVFKLFLKSALTHDTENSYKLK